MDRIKTIAALQWRVFWRRFKRPGKLNAGNHAILLILSVLILIRYLRALQVAASNLSQGDARLLESLLLGCLLAWFFTLAGGRASIGSRKLLHLPLATKELFVVKLLSVFTPPFSWIVLGGSLAICYPIIHSPNPVAGVMAALLFIASSALLGFIIAYLLTIRFWRRLLFLILLAAAFAILYLIKLHDVAGVVSILSLAGPALVSRAALGQSAPLAVLQLGLTTTAMLALAFWSFKKSLYSQSGARSQKFTLFDTRIITSAVTTLAAKDFRYFRRSLDVYLGVLASALGSVYLAAAEVPSAGLLYVFVLIVFFPNSALAFNYFGLDNRAVFDRITLMPLTARSILLSKNLGFVMIVGVQLLPLILLGTWRLGLAVGLLALLEATAVAAMYLSWGNWMSLNHPNKMQFFQFSNSNGLIVEAMAGLLCGNLPGMISIYFLQKEGVAAAWKVGIVVILSILCYLITLSYFSNRYEQKQDRILNAIS